MTLTRAFILGLCITFALLILDTYCVEAVTTTVWEQNSQGQFSKGKPKNVSISSENQIALSRALTPVEGNISELRIWCLAQDSKGNMYAGTGDEGKIFKIAKDGAISLLFDSPETDIFSLILDENDNIYAGTSPDGIIYRIKPDQDIPETFFSTGEKYVWSLAFDRSGNLYAGTGMNGKLYKVSPDGEGKVVYDSNEMHIKTILSSGDYIYAGTEGSGIIYRISSDDKVFVLYDTSEREISCMAVDAHGNLYIGTASGEAVPGREDPSRPGPPGLDERSKQRSAIYQINTDEVATQIWKSPDPLVFSMIVDGDNLLVGTGDEGNIYSVTPDGDWASVADSDESQILSMYKDDDTGEIWFSTGNSGKLFKFSSGYLKAGTLESETRDASVTSRWGNISWDAVQPDSTGVTLSTRSGNSEKPDDTWSEWSEEYTDPAGEEITSPAARFIQWRAKLTSDDGAETPLLKRISVAYLQRNLKPEVKSVSIEAEQKRGEGPPPSRPPGRGVAERSQEDSEIVPFNGNKVIQWQASDPNDDSLEYAVYFRGVEEKNWKLLEEELKGTAHPLDTESFPDGTYLIKVVATDSPSNPMDMALSDEEISDPFDIDNTPPKVLELQAMSTGEGRYVITGKIEDAASYIKNIMYSIDGGDWKPAFPSDQIFDSREENLSFSTEALKAGEHTIAVKANDAAGNVSTSKTMIPAP